MYITIDVFNMDFIDFENIKKRLFRRLFIFLVVINLPCVGNSQDTTNTTNIWGVKVHTGIIIPHSEELKEISNSNPMGLQLEWSKLNLSQEAWEQCNCYSKIGLSLTYFNYRNPDVLGSSYNLILYGEPYLGFKNDIFFTFRAGGGVSYLDQVFDEETNPQNTFYSSPISFLLLLNFAINYELTPQWYVNLSGNYNHISNGGIKHPNRGMNFPTVSLGIDYKPDPGLIPVRQKIKEEKWKVNGYARLFSTRKTKKETEEFPEENEWLIGIAGGISTMFANFNGISTGVEIFRDNTLAVEAKRRGIKPNPYVAGWALGHHFIFGRFNFNQQLIYYLYKPFSFTDKKFYQRYELAYQFSDHLLAGISLRAHGHVADNLDVRLGIGF